MIDLRLGNVLDVLAQMPSESVHCIVTSPPYWGLRSYQTEPQVWRNGSEPCDVHQWETNEPYHKGQVPQTKWANVDAVAKGGNTLTNTCTRCGAWRGELGLEPTPELYVEHIVAVMREARRVLRADGSLWLNIGDSFASGKGTCFNPGGGEHSLGKEHKDIHPLDRGNKSTLATSGLKPKDLVGIPWMVAFALRADGWYLRMDCIWHKPNPMPESVRDRPTKAHEYLFLLSKQPRYYYDSDAVRESNSPTSGKWGKNSKSKTAQAQGDGRHGANSAIGSDTPHDEAVERWYTHGRNRRSVWTVTTHPYSGAHFATFPPKLIEPCILAATSERGVCSKCGAPWVREIGGTKYTPPVVSEGVRFVDESRGDKTRKLSGKDYNEQATRVTLGWRPSCACDAGEPVPATVLDPFNGAGTTGLVALQHGRNYIGIDLKQEYLDMTRERLDKAQIALAAT